MEDHSGEQFSAHRSPVYEAESCLGNSALSFPPIRVRHSFLCVLKSFLKTYVVFQIYAIHLYCRSFTPAG